MGGGLYTHLIVAARAVGTNGQTVATAAASVLCAALCGEEQWTLHCMPAAWHLASQPTAASKEHWCVRTS